MQRCIELATMGAGKVAPNPMVGAVLVHEGTIIGEGYHELYGKAHAEVNCITQAIKNGHSEKFGNSTLYVSLEPCAHFGKTPPCADLIILHKIPRVVVGCRDPFIEVDGKGIEKLEAAGVEVVLDVMKEECEELNRRFLTFHTRHRPYVILKWAQSSDGKIGGLPEKNGVERSERVLISNEYSNRLVHRWRTEEAAILVGTNTALADDPSLTARLWPGNSPTRLVIDIDLRLPSTLKLFDGSVPTIVFNSVKESEQTNLRHWKTTRENVVADLLKAGYHLQILSILVEGGAALLGSFIEQHAWDEARIITNKQLSLGEGLDAPGLTQAVLKNEASLNGDLLQVYRRPH